MKVLVANIPDGHFSAIDISDRKKVKKFIDEYDDYDGGDYVEWIVSDFSDTLKSHWENYNIIAEMYWEQILEHFEQRGTMEIIEL
jgi:hypothetical protein